MNSAMADADRTPTRAELLARWYDLDLHDDPGDLDLYLALAGRGGAPILELAAGSGRLAIPLAAAGHDVVACDTDVAMLDRARAAWAAAGPGRRPRGTLDLVQADLLDLDLGPRFGLVILALNTLLLLETAERQQAALAVMARHLLPDGRAVVDVWLPGPDDLRLYDGRVLLEWERADDASGQRVAKFAAARHDPATGLVELTTIFDAWPAEGGAPSRVSRTDRLRLVGAAELQLMAKAAGLRVETIGADHGLAPFGPGAERVVLVAGLV